jgi:very-short-patch-repair endonuclease
VKRAKPDAGTLLEIHLRELGLSFLREYAFAAPVRKWRFDFVIGPLGAMLPSDRAKCVAVEIEGGIWNHGAHVRGKHFLSDAEKYNTAAALGWKVFRFTPEQILKGQAKAFIEKHWV